MSNEVTIIVNSRNNASKDFEEIRVSSNRMKVDVKKALLDVEQAEINVEKATRRLTEAQDKYEAGSVQVREAENRLEQQKYKLETANKRLEQSEKGAARGAEEAAVKTTLAGKAAAESEKKYVRLKDSLSKFGSVATMALGGVAMAAGVAAVAGVGVGLKTAASMEQAQISYETLLGSTDKAKQHLADLQKFAAATPFELPGLIQADRLLIGAGEDAKNTLKSLRAWGDASGALGQTQDQFSRTMLALSQAMGAGRINAGDMNQIVEAGIPIWKLLSEALGKPQAEIRKLSEKGQLLTKDVLPKLEAQLEKDYGGSMAKQSETLSGLWSTFMDTLNQGLGNVIKPLLPVLRDAMPGAMSALGSALSGIATGLQNTIRWFQEQSKEGGILSRAWDGLTTAISGTAQFYQEHIKPMFEWLGRTMAPLVSYAINQIKQGIDDLQKSGVPWIDLLKALGIGLGAVAVVITGVLAVAIGGLIVQFRIAAGLVKPMWESFKFLARVAMDSFGLIINAAASAFGWIPGIGPKLKSAAKEFNKFRDWANAALDGIHDRQVKVTITALGNGVNLIQQSNGRVTYRNPTGGSVSAQASGGISHAFEGGPRGNLTMVGEHGPELVRLPFGSQVYSNPDTERMTSGSGGGHGRGGSVVLEVIGNDAALVDLIRRLVRIRGGNVQEAFGY